MCNFNNEIMLISSSYRQYMYKCNNNSIEYFSASLSLFIIQKYKNKKIQQQNISQNTEMFVLCIFFYPSISEIKGLVRTKSVPSPHDLKKIREEIQGE